MADKRMRVAKDAQKPWAKAFLESFAKTGVVSLACRTADVPRSTAYAERAQNEEFAKAWASAYEEAVDTLEALLFKRATGGDMYERKTERWTNAEGQEVERVTETHKISDTAMIFALKAARPEKYRDNVRVEQSGPGGLPIQMEVGPIVRTKERVEKLLELARESESASGAEHHALGNGG